MTTFRNLIILFTVFILSSCNSGVNSHSYNDSLRTNSAHSSEKSDDSTQSSSNIDPEIDSLKDISVDSISFKQLLASCRVKKDEFQGKSFFFDKRSPQYVNMNGFFCYVGKTKELTLLRFSVQYTAKNWLFINRMTFNVDGENFDYEPSDPFKRDNGNGQIWEWSDELIDKSNLKMLSKIAMGKVVKVKLYGDQYYNVETLTKMQKDAISHILKIYKGFLLNYK